MASTQTWSEFNFGAGPNVVETTGQTNANWMVTDAADTTGTAYQSVSNVIAVPASGTNYSMTKYQCLKFAGTWNNLSALTYALNTHEGLPTGVTVTGSVNTAYTQPATTASGDSSWGGGSTKTVQFSGTGFTAASVATVNAAAAGAAGPFYATPTTTSSAGGTLYVQCFRTQLGIASTYAGGPGNLNSSGTAITATITASWTES